MNFVDTMQHKEFYILFSCVWVWNLVYHIKEGTKEQGVEEEIWAHRVGGGKYGEL